MKVVGFRGAGPFSEALAKVHNVFTHNYGVYYYKHATRPDPRKFHRDLEAHSPGWIHRLLCWAVDLNRPDVLRFMVLEGGCDPRALDEKGQSALFAMKWGRSEAALELVRLGGVDLLDLKNSDGWTFLARHNHVFGEYPEVDEAFASLRAELQASAEGV